MTRNIRGPRTAELVAAREKLKARRKLPEMERRRAASEATMAKFLGKPFNWGEGWHCIKMAHYHLRQMGKRPPSLPRVRSALAAKRAMKERGWDSVVEMLDQLLTPVPRAMLRLGDLVATPGTDGMDSVMIYLAPHRFLGWLPDGSEAVVLDMDEFSGAWQIG